jgi:uncharacterized membrane protein YbaN (DUF454 family)
VTPFNLRDRLRKLPAGEVIVHGAVFVVGLAFIGLGIALSVLPGPFTIPFILVGLLVWSLEFDFAERWLDRAKVQAQEAWDAAQAHPWRTGLVTAGGILLLVVGAVLASKYGLVERAKDVVT